MAVDLWKILRLLVSILLTGFLLYNISNRLNAPVDGIEIYVDNVESGKKLIKEKEIRALLKFELGFDLGIAEVRELELNRLEKMLDSNSRIEKAELYMDKNNILHVQVRQKTPIVRVDVTGADDYYLDFRGDQVPVTETFRVPVVTGHVDRYTSNYHTKKDHNLNDVLELARKVHNDSFLSALVEQIHIDGNDEITLVPKLGRDKILIGEATDLDEKIYKLKIYYEKGIKNIGLERFDELDLKYRGQIIGRQKDT